MMKKLLAQRRDLTAVFAANDAMSFGVIRAVSEAGLRVPEDISVIGFDNLELAAIIRPPLTTIHQPKYELGTSAVEILLRHAQRPESWTPEHRLLGVKLVERESCRRLEGDAENGAERSFCTWIAGGGCPVRHKKRLTHGFGRSGLERSEGRSS